MTDQDRITGKLIEQLILFGIHNSMMTDLDTPLVRNQLMSLMKIAEPYSMINSVDKITNSNKLINNEELTNNIDYSTPLSITTPLLDISVSKGFIEDNTTERDLFDARIMACLMPRQSELFRIYSDIKAEKGVKAGTEFFYKLSKDSNYIRMDRISKNLYWQTKTDYGNLEITINLSKPEKDPKEIAKARLVSQASYPKCLLCLENVGYEGRLNHPGRTNHRVLPLTLNNENWFLQYSPYVYYNEHSIVFKGEHVPMKICKETFVRLLDFIEEIPHYFLGSNADLPIVGGSILSHDHFQGGHHEFPMEAAPIIAKTTHDNYPNVNIGIVKWPLSVIRLSSINKEELVNFAEVILKAWREYSDETLGIYAYSGDIPHNTITPISRKNKEGMFELDLVLRNNRQSDEHPDGIFHPHAHLHHIKKENIGLIEVMGLAVLPARLKEELANVESVLEGKLSIDELTDNMEQHKPWIKELKAKYMNNLQEVETSLIIQQEVGKKFEEVLACAGVYKLDEEGLCGFKRFLDSL